MKTLPENSVDSIVTDPPYSYRFMAKKWDADLPAVEIWKECLRLLKPGGFLLSFGGCRTYHRLVCNIEDAGFIIHPLIAWIFGSGFPKAANLSKRIDQQAGQEREVIGESSVCWGPSVKKGKAGFANLPFDAPAAPKPMITAPATEAAQQWDGFFYGLQALKPAIEPICMAQKPYEGKPVDSILKWGCGALNIDGCRIGTEDSLGRKNNVNPYGNTRVWTGSKTPPQDNRENPPQGRWPANVILEESAVKELGKQSGESVSKRAMCGQMNVGKHGGFADLEPNPKEGTNSIRGYNDSGSAARFFYCAKSSQADRDDGLEGMEKQKRDPSRKEGNPGGDNPYNRGVLPKTNYHPTVKPVSLMRWLVRLVTPPGGIVLDLFMGSGSTGKAAIHENFQFIGIEKEGDYIDIAIARIKKAILDVGPGPLFTEEKK